MAGPSENARDSWTALALDHGVAPLAEFSLSSIVAAGESEGVPFVLADPSAQISKDISSLAGQLLGQAPVPAGAGRS